MPLSQLDLNIPIARTRGASAALNPRPSKRRKVAPVQIRQDISSPLPLPAHVENMEPELNDWDMVTDAFHQGVIYDQDGSRHPARDGHRVHGRDHTISASPSDTHVRLRPLTPSLSNPDTISGMGVFVPSPPPLNVYRRGSTSQSGSREFRSLSAILSADGEENVGRESCDPIAQPDQDDANQDGLLSIFQRSRARRPSLPANPARRFDPRGFISRLYKCSIDNQGTMTFVCDHCSAKHWLGEAKTSSSRRSPVFELCCKDGLVRLPELRRPPLRLYNLLINQDPEAKMFRKHIREYNCALALTSVNYKPDRRTATGGNRHGPDVFRIQGELYHLHGPIVPDQGYDPKFNQLYFYDDQYAVEEMDRRNKNCRNNVLLDLLQLLKECNPLLHLYQSAYERLQENPASQRFLRIILKPNMTLVMEEGADRRRANLPTTSEVAVVIPDDLPTGDSRDILLAHRTVSGQVMQTFTRIKPTSDLYMPLHYVLLFPYGDKGFTYDLDLADGPQVRKSNKLHQRPFYRYRLHFRGSAEFSAIFYGCRLFQQYIVDAFCACEHNALDWLRTHQKNICADVYSGLVDQVQRSDNTVTGRRVILPASFHGGPRFMHHLYQNSMAIVRHFGRPTLFITMTANPRWPEILRELLPGQDAVDRPDITSRVFNLKVRAIIDDIRGGNGRLGIFGHYIGHVYTIEYQKRGLPHMHLLLFLDTDDEFLETEGVDKIICAELPAATWTHSPQLTELVQRNMTHGPCGLDNPKAPCMVQNGKTNRLQCSKGFPKPFNPATDLGRDSFPLYRRRDDRRQWPVKRQGSKVGDHDEFIMMDNRYVVPYNPYLLMRYQCHINVELCANVSAVKYVHKYIFKGHDLATAQIELTDEITRYISGRYLGPNEAFARIFEFPTHGEWPPVVTLGVHLENQQVVYNADWMTAEDKEIKARDKPTKLMAWFRYNAKNEDGRHLLYQEFPEHFTFDPKAFKWKPRKQKTTFAIGRMFHLSPNMGEQFYLRLLLTHVRGAQSFRDLRIVDYEEYDTYHQAAVAYGLAEDDKEWFHCFDELALDATGHQLRSLFIMGLTNGQIVDGTALWDRFARYFCDDLPPRLQGRDDVPHDLLYPHYDYGLFLLQRALLEMGKSLADYRLPAPVHIWSRGEDENPFIAEQYQYDITAEAERFETNRQSLNTDQTTVFDKVTTAIRDDPTTAHFFLQGPAGTGKTFLYKTICNYYRSKGEIVLCVASSGIAALLLPGGRTSHSRFKIPLTADEASTANIPIEGKLAGLIRKTTLVIWDEVPMQHKYCFEAVDRSCRHILGEDDKPFGGIPFILGGDFAQILPVVPGGSRAQVVNACILRSHLWGSLRQVRLRKNMRIQDGRANQEYARFVRRIPTDKDLIHSVPIPEGVTCFTDPNRLYRQIYPDAMLNTPAEYLTAFKDRALLALTNHAVAAINTDILERFPGFAREFLSVDTASDVSDSIGAETYTVELLQSIDLAGMPPSKLNLKTGVPVILLRNLNPAVGLCNGTRMMIQHMNNRSLTCVLLGGEFHGSTQLIPRIRLNSLESDGLGFILSRKQFPVKLCFGMTVNKSQGQSFNHVGLDLRTQAFTHGQLYVAFSRVTNLRGISVLLKECNLGRTANVVFPEVLQSVV